MCVLFEYNHFHNRATCMDCTLVITLFLCPEDYELKDSCDSYALISLSFIAFCTTVFIFDEHPLTTDERFLISLLALNTEGSFNGFKRTQQYAKVNKEGEISAFLPVPPWLQA